MNQEQPISSGFGRTYKAAAYLESSSSKRTSGNLTIMPDSLLFVSEDLTIELPLNGLKMWLGGASDRIVFFSHERQPEKSFFTTDQSILKDSIFLEREDILSQVKSVHQKKRNARLYTAGVFAFIFLCIYGLLQLLDPLASAVTGKIPPSLEVEVGNALFKGMASQQTMLDDAKTQSMIDELVAPLVENIPEKDQFTFQFHVLHDPTINAYAVPGGNMVLHSGLILRAESPEEILGVVSHEISHVTCRHSMRQIVGTLGLFTLLQLFFGDVTGIQAVLIEGGASLTTLDYSRDHEREADERGWEYLVSAGINPKGMISFFEKLKIEMGEKTLASSAEESLSMLSTHPATQERIDRLSEKLRETDLSQISPVEYDLEALQDHIRQQINESPVKETDE